MIIHLQLTETKQELDRVQTSMVKRVKLLIGQYSRKHQQYAVPK
jgi:hypothetical protein